MPQALVGKANAILESYQKKLYDKTGSRQFTLCADEMSDALYDPQFRVFFSEFYEQNKENPDLKFIGITHYPMASYDWRNVALPSIPDVWARPWNNLSSSEYCKHVKWRTNEVSKVEWAVSHFGGCPDMLNRFYDRQEDPDQIISNYVTGQARSMLRQSDAAEYESSLLVLDKLIQGKTFKPTTELEEAAIIHLLVAGLAKPSSGGFVIQGLGIQEYLNNPPKMQQFMEWIDSSRQPQYIISAMPYVEERKKHNISLVSTRPLQNTGDAPVNLKYE